MCRKTFAERLDQAMKSKNLRQADVLQLARPFCESMGVKLNRNDMSQYLSGKAVPRQKKLTVLARALNISEPWLMGYDVPMEDYPASRDTLKHYSEVTNVDETARKAAALDLISQYYDKDIAALVNIYDQLSSNDRRRLLDFADALLTTEKRE